MKKKFLFNLILLVILNLLVKPFWVFGIDMEVQNMVGSNEYGLLFPLFNLSVIFNILLDLGITNFNNLNISQNKELFRGYLPNILAIKFILTFLYIIIVFAFAMLVGYESRQLFVLLLLVINQVIISFTLYLRSNLSGMQYYTTDSILSVTDRIIMICACLTAYFCYFINKKVNVEWFVFLQTLSYAVNFVLIIFVLLAKTGSIKFNFSRQLSLQIFKASLPYAVLIFLMSVYSRIDSVMLERMLPNGRFEAGIYAQSFRILDSANMLAILFAGLLFPMFSGLIGRKEDVAPLTKLSFHLIWVIAIAFTFACMLYSSRIIPVLYNEGDAYSSLIFSILIFCFIPMTVINIFGSLLTAGRNLKILNKIALFSVLINIILNLILIPSYFAVGAAIAGLITQCFVAIYQLIAVRGRYGTLFFDLKRIIVFTVISSVLSWVIFEIVSSWISGFMIIGIFVGITGIITGLLPFHEIKKVLFSLQKWDH